MNGARSATGKAARNILITGASGGIGAELAAVLAAQGHRLLLNGRDERALTALRKSLSDQTDVSVVCADLLDEEGLPVITDAASTFSGGIDSVVHAAGINHFGLLDTLEDDAVSRIFRLNVELPARLTRALLPQLKSRPAGQIVFIGSMLGRIGYPGNAAYCASKAAVRALAESLRRELADTALHVVHVAPRATRTRFNSPAQTALNDRLHVRSDDAAHVARVIARAMAHNHANTEIGWPEKFFARLNALFPALVDRGLSGQLAEIKRYAGGTSATDDRQLVKLHREVLP